MEIEVRYASGKTYGGRGRFSSKYTMLVTKDPLEGIGVDFRFDVPKDAKEPPDDKDVVGGSFILPVESAKKLALALLQISEGRQLYQNINSNGEITFIAGKFDEQSG